MIKYIDELLPSAVPASSVAFIDASNSTRPAAAYIDACLDQAINDVLKVCSTRYITLINSISVDCANGNVALPSALLRIISLRTDDRTISIVPEGSQLHKYQSYPHIAATAVKPVAVLFNDNTIRIYPATQIGALKYVPKAYSAATNWDSNTYFTDDLIPVICWQCAGKTLAVFGDQRAQMALELAAKMID